VMIKTCDVAACRCSVGPSLHQLQVRDDVAVIEEDSNCCSMVDVTTATSVSLQHAAVAVSQTDTGYQSNIMQTTGPLSTTTATAGMPCIQHVDSANSFDRTEDL